MRIGILVCLSVAGICGLLAVPAPAGILALDLTSPPVHLIDASSSSTGPWSLGWEFDLTADLWVSALGFYDHEMNGLNQSHLVGIFNSSGNLLVSATVTPSDPLQSWWRWVTLPSPVLLNAGSGYRIAAVTETDPAAWWDENNLPYFTTALGVTYVRPRISEGTSSLVFPTATSTSDFGYLGPNFMVVPEPSMYGLLGFGLLALGLWGRRRAACREESPGRTG